MCIICINAKVVVKAKEEVVDNTAKISSVKQNTFTEFTVTMSKALDTVTAADFSMVRDDDNQVITVKSATLDAKDKTQIKLAVYTSLTDAKTYTITYTAADEAKTQSSAKVTVTDGTVADVNITPTEITANQATKIEYQTLDANGVIVSQKGVAQSETKVDVTWDSVLGTMDNSNSYYILYNVGDTAKFTVTYHTYKYDATTGAELNAITKDFTVTLGNLSFDVAPGTVIKSFSVSADSDIYAGESATLSYVAVDAEGKEVTSFDVLKKAFGGTTPTTNVTLSKQTDGSGKLTYKQADDVTNTDSTNHRGSDSKVLTFQLYSGTANIIVVNTSIRVNEKRYIWEVTGVNADKAVAGVSGTALSFKAEDLKIADQYGNTLSKDNINDLVANGGIKVSNAENPSNFTLKGVSAGNSAVISTKTATFGAIVASGGSVKLNIKSYTNTNDAGYDLTLSQANAEKASTFEIKWNDSVNTFCTTKAAMTASAIKSKFTVVGKVGGKTVTIPSDNYEVTGLTGGDKLGEINSATNTVEKTIEGTVTVTVRTTDDNGKSVATDVSATFTNSNADPKLASIKANNDATVSYNSGTLQVANLASGFTLKDQYGNAIGSDGVVATVVILDSSNGDVEYNGTTACKVTGVQQNDKISITLKKGDLTANREVTLGA